MTLKEDVFADAKAILQSYSTRGWIRNVNLCDRDTTSMVVSQKNAQPEGRIEGIGEYSQEFLNAFEKRSYVCQLFDGSLIQMFFEFKERGRVLNRGSLAYCPNPGFESDFIENIARMNDQDRADLAEWTEAENEPEAGYLRLDYDVRPESYRAILHPCAHLHLGIGNGARIAANRYPYFSEFLRMIWYLFYRERWLEDSFGSIDEQVSLQQVADLIQRRKEFLRTNSIHAQLSNHEKEYLLLNL